MHTFMGQIFPMHNFLSFQLTLEVGRIITGITFKPFPCARTCAVLDLKPVQMTSYKIHTSVGDASCGGVVQFLNG